MINAGDGTDTITDLMGFNVRPWVDAAGSDVIKFVGANMTAANMRLYQSNADVIVTFDGVANTQLMLKNVWNDALDNLAGSKYGFIFNGESGVTDSFDTLNWGAQAAQVSHANSVTFLTAQNNTISGLENSNDVINGQDGNDVIAGLSGNDVLRGDSGNDTLTGGAGNDKLDGGSDYDVAVFAGAFSNYTIAKGANVTVKDLTGAEGTDTLVGIEKLQFADRTLLLDGTNNAPTAVDDAATATEKAVVTGNLLTNDSDIDGDALQAIAKTLLSDRGANVTIGADGSYSYDPRGSTELQALNTGQSVVDGFKYTLDDGHGGTATGTVKVVEGGLEIKNDAGTGSTVMASAAAIVVLLIVLSLLPGSGPLGPRPRERTRALRLARQQPVDVVIDGEDHQAQQQRHADPLPHLHCAIRQRAALQHFGEIIQQVPPIEDRDGQQIEHAEADGNECDEAHVRQPSQLRRLPRVVGDGDRPGQVFPGHLPHQHLAQHLLKGLH